MVEAFNNKFQQIISKHLKKKFKYVKSPFVPPWLDEEVRLNIKKRDFFKTANRWEEYKNQCNYTTNLIKPKKKQHVEELILNSKGRQTKHLWNILKTRNALTLTQLTYHHHKVLIHQQM